MAPPRAHNVLGGVARRAGAPLGAAARSPPLLVAVGPWQGPQHLRCASTTAAAAAARSLRTRLDASVVGHADAKEALVLALLAREHVLLEGPPGVAKTLLAEELARAAGLAPKTLQLHRDSRADELLSAGSVLRREPMPDGGEAIRHVSSPGGLLEADVCVLDDLGRAPGEALSALLRALAERRGDVPGASPASSSSSIGRAIPLRSAIATASSVGGYQSAPHEGNHTDALDPALMDRFALQLRLGGMLSEGRWREAERVLARGSLQGDRAQAEQQHKEERMEEAVGGALSSSTRSAPSRLPRSAAELAAAVEGAADGVAVPRRVQGLLLRVVQELAARSRMAKDSFFLLSDRTFLVKAVRVLRAKAASEGRDSCVPEDLLVLRLLTAFRVPPEVHAELPALIEAILAAEEQEEQNKHDPDWRTAASEEDVKEEGGKEGAVEDGADGPRAEEAQDVQDQLAADSSKNSQDGPPREMQDTSPGTMEDMEQDQNSDRGLLGTGPAITMPSKLSGDDPLAGGGHEMEDSPSDYMSLLDVDEVSVENIDILLSRLVGSIDAGNSELSENSGGSPRRWRAWDPREAAEFGELDAVEMHRWAQDPSPAAWPRTRQRMRRNRGGLVAVLRDVSMSMTGVNATWSARVTLALLEAARKRRMRFGYIEFNHRSKKYCQEDGTFFSTDYNALSDAAVNLSCQGWTNYEQPLTDALREFAALSPAGSGGRVQQQRHVLLITDGVPTHGDPWARRQRARAKDLGVVVHSVYLGWPMSFPKALQAISESTQGSQFCAFYQPARRRGGSGPRSTAGSKEPRTRGPLGTGLDSGYINVVERVPG